MQSLLAYLRALFRVPDRSIPATDRTVSLRFQADRNAPLYLLRSLICTVIRKVGSRMFLCTRNERLRSNGERDRDKRERQRKSLVFGFLGFALSLSLSLSQTYTHSHSRTQSLFLLSFSFGFGFGLVVLVLEFGSLSLSLFLSTLFFFQSVFVFFHLSFYAIPCVREDLSLWVRWLPNAPNAEKCFIFT